MKKTIRFIMATMAVLIMAAGCSSSYDEPDSTPDSRETIDLSLSVNAEGLDATRAYDNNIDRLVMAVYDNRGNLLPELGETADGQTIIDITAFPVDVNLTLVKGQEYKIAFWACSSQYDGNGYETSDLRQVKADYSVLPINGTGADAFFKTETFTAVTDGMRAVTLRRALSTLNFIMLPADFESVKLQGGTSVEVSATGLPQVFDVLTGDVSDFSENSVTFPSASIGDSKIDVDFGDDYTTPEEGYPLLASVYTFAPEKSAKIPSVTFRVPEIGEVETEGLIYQRNHSTNVLVTKLGL